MIVFIANNEELKRLEFLYLCTGFAISTALVSMTHIVSFLWHATEKRLEAGESGNLKGALLAELVAAWAVLGISISVAVLLSTLYPE